MEEFKPAWYQQNGTLAAAALAITLAVHLIFALLVRPVSDHENVEWSAHSDVVLLTQHGLPAKAWRRLNRWIRENDPAIVADSASPYGYSVMRQPVEPERQLRNRDPLRFPAPAVTPPAIPALPETPEPLETVRSLRWSEAFAAPVAKTIPRREVTCFDDFSRPVEGKLFKQAYRSWLADNDGRPFDPEKPTVIRWRSMRPELVSGCGVPALDAFAIAALSSPRNRPAGCTFLTIYWPASASKEEVKK